MPRGGGGPGWSLTALAVSPPPAPHGLERRLAEPRECTRPTLRVRLPLLPRFPWKPGGHSPDGKELEAQTMGG